MKKFNEYHLDEIASYKRSKNGGFSDFYNATNDDLASKTPETTKIKKDAMSKVYDNIIESITLVENVPVTDWFEEPIDLIKSLYSLKERLEDYNKYYEQ